MENDQSAAVAVERVDLLPCPFCGTDEHLAVSRCGSLTGDMPSRPYRVVCDHIDHDQVQGPVAYGKQAAITAWNTRATPEPQHSGDEVVRIARSHDEITDRWAEQCTRNAELADENRQLREALGQCRDKFQSYAISHDQKAREATNPDEYEAREAKAKSNRAMVDMLDAALSATPPTVAGIRECWACEGKPAASNNPCAVCGRATPTEASRGEVARRERGKMLLDAARYAHKVLEAICNNGGYPPSGGEQWGNALTIYEAHGKLTTAIRALKDKPAEGDRA